MNTEDRVTIPKASGQTTALQATGARSEKYGWTVRVFAGLGVFATTAAFLPMLKALVEQPGRNVLLSVLLHLSIVIALWRYLGAITLTGRRAPTSPWTPFSSGAVTAVVAAIVVASHVIIMASGWDNAAVDAVRCSLLPSLESP